MIELARSSKNNVAKTLIFRVREYMAKYSFR